MLTKIGLVELIELRYIALASDIRQFLTFDDVTRDEAGDDMQHGDRFINLRVSARYEALIVTDQVE